MPGKIPSFLSFSNLTLLRESAKVFRPYPGAPQPVLPEESNADRTGEIEHLPAVADWCTLPFIYRRLFLLDSRQPGHPCALD